MKGAPAFDPSKPFTVDTDSVPAFDPSKPFEADEEAAKPRLTLASAAFPGYHESYAPREAAIPSFGGMQIPGQHIPRRTVSEQEQKMLAGGFDALTLPTRALGAAAAEVGYEGASGGKQGLEALADPETGIARPIRKKLETRMGEQMAGLKDKDRSLLGKAANVVGLGVDAAGYALASTIEDPVGAYNATTGAIGKVSKAIGLTESIGSGAQAMSKGQFRSILKAGITAERKAKDLIGDAAKHNLIGDLDTWTIPKAQGKLSELKTELKTAIKSGVDEGESSRINPKQLVDNAIADVKKEILAQEGNAADNLQMLRNLESDKAYINSHIDPLLELVGTKDLDLVHAQDLKQTLGRLGDWRFVAKSKGIDIGESESRSMLAEKVYHKLKEAIEDNAAPGVQRINKEISEVAGVLNAAQYRNIIASRNNTVSLGDMVTLGAAVANPSAWSLFALQRATKSGTVARKMYEFGSRMIGSKTGAERELWHGRLIKLGMEEEEVKAALDAVQASSGPDAFMTELRIRAGQPEAAIDTRPGAGINTPSVAKPPAASPNFPPPRPPSRATRGYDPPVPLNRPAGAPTASAPIQPEVTAQPFTPEAAAPIPAATPRALGPTALAKKSIAETGMERDDLRKWITDNHKVITINEDDAKMLGLEGMRPSEINKSMGRQVKIDKNSRGLEAIAESANSARESGVDFPGIQRGEDISQSDIVSALFDGNKDQKKIGLTEDKYLHQKYGDNTSFDPAEFDAESPTIKPSGNEDDMPLFQVGNRGIGNDVNMGDLLSKKGESVSIGDEDGAFLETGISKLRSKNGSTRYLYSEDGDPKAVLQIMSKDGEAGTIANVFTVPEMRRKGVASKLLTEAKNDFKKLTHSENKTESGTAWAKASDNIAKSSEDDMPLFQSAQEAGLPKNSKSKSVIEKAKKAWEEKGTESPFFKRWFDKSKTVDKDNKPQVVYHGTGDVFTKVKPEKGSQSIFWITSDKAAIDAKEVGAAGHGNVMDLYARINKPAGWKEYDQLTLDELQQRGYDGAILPKKNGTFDAFVFDGNQIKSATKNAGTFDPENPSILYQSAPDKPNAPTFYSKLSQAIEQKMPNSADPQTIRGIIKGAGVKEEEVKWMDVDGFLEGKVKVSKQELLDHLEQNKVEIEEVVKGIADNRTAEKFTQDQFPDAWDRGYRYVARGKSSAEKFFKTDSEAERWINSEANAGAIDKTKFSQYQEPGGKNYRELLLTLPDKTPNLTNLEWKKNPSGKWAWFKNGKQNSGAFPNEADSEIARPTINDIKDDRNFKSSHFDEPNILAHVRFNDRMTPDGKKILHLEEVQSDWHQAGRKKGYQSNSEGAFGTSQDNRNHRWYVKNFESGERFGSGYAYEEDALNAAKIKNNENKIPDAPFKKTWHELALRRMLRYASENGYDGVSWTGGAKQAARYDLSKQIGELAYWKTNDGRIGMNSVSPEGRVLDGMEQELEPSQLEDFVGKDVAKKIIEDLGESDPIHFPKENGVKYLRGDDLSVGGEGMKTFYDKMIPQYLDKYGKKWGAKVEDIEIPTPELTDEHFNIHDPKAKRSSVQSLMITDAMRKSVMEEGQPLFQGPKGQFQRGGDFGAITLFKGKADLSTIIHENAHAIRNRLDMAQSEGRIPQGTTDKLLRWTGQKSWTREAEEKFARGVERYQYDGHAPSKNLEPAFKTIKESMAKIYKDNVDTELGTSLPPEIKMLYDAIYLQGKKVDPLKTASLIKAIQRSSGVTAARLMQKLQAEINQEPDQK